MCRRSEPGGELIAAPVGLQGISGSAVALQFWKMSGVLRELMAPSPYVANPVGKAQQPRGSPLLLDARISRTSAVLAVPSRMSWTPADPPVPMAPRFCRPLENAEPY